MSHSFYVGHPELLEYLMPIIRYYLIEEQEWECDNQPRYPISSSTVVFYFFFFPVLPTALRTSGTGPEKCVWVHACVCVCLGRCRCLVDPSPALSCQSTSTPGLSCPSLDKHQPSFPQPSLFLWSWLHFPQGTLHDTVQLLEIVYVG